MIPRTNILFVVTIVVSVGVAVCSAHQVPAGDDAWVTECDGQTFINLGDPDATPIPAGFFGPGSDPFAGLVTLGGRQLVLSGGNPPKVDTIVRRTGATSAGFTCGPATVENIPIEIVALNLVSCSPITVTYNGGQNPQSWNVEVCLSATQGLGTMTLRHECSNGGSFTVPSLPVSANLTFNRVGTGDLRGPITRSDTFVFTAAATRWWSHDNTTSPALDRIAAGTMFDTDCDSVADTATVNGASASFYVGLASGSCGFVGCGGSPGSFQKALTQEDALWASHGVKPPNLQKQPPFPAIPATTAWGVAALGAMVVIAALLVFKKRKPALA